jgi:hypothetical protein
MDQAAGFGTEYDCLGFFYALNTTTEISPTDGQPPRSTVERYTR